MNFPSIEQFRHVIKSVERKARFAGLNENNYPIYDDNVELPVCKLTGTVKLHGTNAAVELKDGEILFRRRRGVLTKDESHYGFRKFAEEREDVFRRLIRRLLEDCFPETECILYGEWVGNGVLKGCAIHELDPAFYIFAVRVGEEWLPITNTKDIHANEQGIFNITQFPTFEITIDFNAPKASVSRLEELTAQVEAECPVASQRGVQGIGEGIVWTFDDPEFNSSEFWFKVKGDKHRVTKTKKKVEVEPEKAKSINEFVDAVLTDARLEQGMENIPEPDRRHTGTFLKWVANDVLKEETDRMEASDLEKSDVTKAISNKARDWFFARLSEM